MKLTYFNVRGLGELPRLLLIDNGVDFEDQRVDKEREWPQLKPKMKFGQIPCLYDGDFEVVQSGAIMRYLARKVGKGLYGANDKEATCIDMIYEGVNDLREKYWNLIYHTEFTDADKKKFMAETLPSELEKFEKLLKAKDGGAHYFNGAKISFVDYAVFEMMDALLTLCAQCLDKYPLLKAHHGRVAAREHLKTYLATDRRKNTPINGNGKQ